MAVGFGIIFLKAKQRWLKYLGLVLWFLFLPNTIYILTDIMYFPNQFMSASLLEKLVLLPEFGLLMLVGFWSYLQAMRPLENIFKNSQSRVVAVVLVNFFIAFAVAIGKVQRTESWYFITNFKRVVSDSLITLETDQVMLFVLIFALITNF